LLTILSARQLGDGQVVFAGVGIPLLAATLAQRLHCPSLTILFEGGVIGAFVEPGKLPPSTNDQRCTRRANMVLGSADVLLLLQRGYVDIGFMGGAQIDRFGNLNSTSIGTDPCHPKVRFSGSGGACDIACLAMRTVVIALHEKRRFPQKVDYVTSPGWLEGGDSRKRAGLIRGGPSAIVTTKGVMRFRAGTRTMYLASYHPGLTAQAVADDTGFALDISGAAETSVPTGDELRILRDVVDPERVFLK